jgi:hypothetical protein
MAIPAPRGGIDSKVLRHVNRLDEVRNPEGAEIC